MYIKPKEKWIIEWKKNRNHRGRAEVISQKAAYELADEKRNLGFKVKIKREGGGYGH